VALRSLNLEIEIAPGGENDEACAQAGLDKVADHLK
jgi:hypothetical protein